MGLPAETSERIDSVNRLHTLLAMDEPAPKRDTLGIATLITAVLILVVLVGMLGLDIWKTTQPDATGLAGDVQTSMNSYFQDDETLSSYGASAGSVSVMRAGENKFEATVDVSSRNGKHRSIPVHVNYDGDSMFWTTDPGAFLFMIPSP